MDSLSHRLRRPSIAPMTHGAPGGPPLRSELLYPGMSVGLFGGSFNPAHAGHLHVARTAMRRLQLDRVWFLVSPQNPLKDASETDRYWRRAAGVWALGDYPRMTVSDVERRLGAAYSMETVLALSRRWPEVNFVWLMGSDNLAGFHRWRGWQTIMETLPVAVIARRGTATGARLGRAARQYANHRVPEQGAKNLALMRAPAWTYLTAPLHPQSSSAIRAEARS
ncbi:nicotinate-nucleotide adenylyltransferase [Euryhalocaulis caribicus]|uniref:nicotinate-nucleotide adenylyltransferase n=1 Tax=Euryhalocaulis caribicus TaxID=1161401 RepID=UPI0003A63B94|nr:nicotinate-nucleotide adenylyltransferase [Euryhalocaulis caribicus]